MPRDKKIDTASTMIVLRRKSTKALRKSFQIYNGLIHRLEGQQKLLRGQDGGFKGQRFGFSAKRKTAEAAA